MIKFITAALVSIGIASPVFAGAWDSGDFEDLTARGNEKLNVAPMRRDCFPTVQHLENISKLEDVKVVDREEIKIGPLTGKISYLLHNQKADLYFILLEQNGVICDHLVLSPVNKRQGS